jgi:F-type H+-transporting ATPase subunit delta
MPNLLDESKIARRYAKAFFEDAVAANKVEHVMAFLPVWWANFSQIEGVLAFFTSPAVSHAEKKDTIRQQFPDLLDHPFTLRLLDLLIGNGRFNVLGSVVEQFFNLSLQYQKTVVVKVTSPFPIEQDLLERLGESLKPLLGCDHVGLETFIDPGLLGGVVLRYDDKIIDGSIDGKLKRLATQLKP